MLIVHHLNDSRSQRVLWLLEELDIAYEIKKYQRTPQQLAPEELKAVNPLGTAPVITDGSVTLAESGAVIEYIIRKYANGKAQPPESGEVDDLYYTHYTEGSLMPLVVNRLVLGLVVDKAPFFIRPLISLLVSQILSRVLDPRLKLHAALIETHLSRSSTGWFAGGDEPTSADYMIIFALEAWSGLCPDMLGSNTKAFIERVHNRPAYKRSIEKGGPYAFARL
ncbi:thioredoxin-like protein [Laetiporus sulphureus 93-53]|uniref:glutathione transferase n=1 Tax=Laetiporus sulphureus 93-53 TaxID=1314785 RepID=A0A165GIC0_9APHY|nr:thioredoxin-like protein [Laetiporus sulphureus 93-53]KZT10388.1 thioredoxin-like protein [Laetiporus sulphureus 93-53]